MYTIGIDIGGQTAKIGIVDHNGNIITQSSIVSNSQTNASAFINDLYDEISSLLKNNNLAITDITGVGVGAPNGNFYEGAIINAANLPWAASKYIPFAKMLKEKLNIPVTLTNDANAAAMGEMIYGAAKNMKNFIMITLGTGVGSGIVVDGKVVYGHDGLAGEIGHTCYIRGGRPCNCGRNGCLETYTSASGVARTAKEFVLNSEIDTTLKTLNPEKITSKDVYEAAIKGDKVALNIFKETGRILGEALSDAVAFTSPEAIILFGGLTHAGKLIFDPIVESLNLNLLSFWKNKIKVLQSHLPESDAAILGASALAVNETNQSYSANNNK